MDSNYDIVPSTHASASHTRQSEKATSSLAFTVKLSETTYKGLKAFTRVPGPVCLLAAQHPAARHSSSRPAGETKVAQAQYGELDF